MRPKYTETMLRLTREIIVIAKDLPPGKGHQIMNRCNKINVTIKKLNNGISKTSGSPLANTTRGARSIGLK